MGSFLKNIHPLLSRSKQEPSDTNYAILNAIESVLNEVEEETIDARKQSSLKTASGKYLEVYGDWFGVRRRDGESDTRYRRRIVRYVDMPRGTNQSIILAVRRYLADPYVGVEIYEPYEDIFTLNKSKLNGSHGLMGHFYRFAVIRVDIGRPFDDDLIDYLYRFTPSGVRVHVNYDPSLPRRNDSAANVSASLFTMTPGEAMAEVTRYSGLEKYIGGRIQLGDSDEVLRSFITNHSKMNAEDVLTGSFTHGRDLYHIFGKATNIPLKMTNKMGELYSQIEDLPKENYTNTTSQTGMTEFTRLSLTPSEEAYMVWNLDKYISTKYIGSEFNIKRTREDYAAILEGSAFTMTSKSDSRGNTFDLEIYNFSRRRWEVLNRQVANGRTNTIHSVLENPVRYLNTNRLMVTRIKVRQAIEIDLDYMALDYRKEIK